jgi:oxidase EvaA
MTVKRAAPARTGTAAVGTGPGLGPVSVPDLYRSRTTRAALHDDVYVDRWLQERRRQVRLSSVPVSLAQLDQWRIEEDSGNISHGTGRFFSITGLQVRHRTPDGELCWDQPIIDQPEFGILGVLAARFDGVLHFCLRAKEEPGNLNGVQLAPTVQATYSNYTRVHGGKQPLLLEHFLAPAPGSVVFAKLQTEDGSRFLFKSNRNMIVLAPAGGVPELPEDAIWLTLRQIAALLQRDNVVNACARSVLSCLLWTASGRSLDGGTAPAWPEDECALQEARSRFVGPGGRGQDPHSLNELIQWIDDEKAGNHILQKRMKLNRLRDWELDPRGFFRHREGRFFTVVGISVQSPYREIASWSQPILVNAGTGIVGLLVRRRRGRLYGLFQAKAEVGNRHLVQIAPTVQFTPANYQDNVQLKKPFLYEEFVAPSRFAVLHESRQSEEGGRFYKEDHVHRILLHAGTDEPDLPPAYRWLSLDQVRFFLHLGEKVNSCTRSILACLL